MAISKYLCLLLIVFGRETMNDYKPVNGLQTGGGSEFRIFSKSFKEGEFIPALFTCDGPNISPELNWTTPPAKTQTFLFINDDPDAPAGDWVHWLVYNIPKDTRELKENASLKKLLPEGAIEGINDFNKICYGGPCPPSGIHRYFFKLYALDIALNPKKGASKNQLLSEIKGHILAQATLIGKYKRAH